MSKFYDDQLTSFVGTKWEYPLPSSQETKTMTDWTKELTKIGIKAGVVYVGSKIMTPKQAIDHAKKFTGQ